MITNFFKRNISSIKFIYTFVYMLYFSITYNCYLDHYFNVITTALYTPLIFIGVVIIVADFFFSGLLLRFKSSWLLILFYVSCLVSIVLNIAYDPVGNLTVIVWMLIQTFLIATVNCEYREEFHKKRFRILIEGVSFVWFAGVLASLVMFVLGVSDLVETTNTASGYTRAGIIDGRLFGVFDDPNYASMCIMFTMLLIISNMFLNKENTALKIYHIVLLVFDYFYIILSGSRTTELCLYISVAIIAFFAAVRFCTKRGIKGIKQYLAAVLAALLGIIISIGAYLVTDFGLTKVYVLSSRFTSEYDELHNYEEDLIRPDVEYSNDISNNRLAIWTDYLKLFKDKPIFGTAPRNGVTHIREVMPDSFVAKRGYSFHNGYLALLVGSGLVGSIFMLGFIILNVIRILSYLIRRSGAGDRYYIPVLMMTAILATAAISAVPLMAIVFCNSIFDVIFWFVFGYTLSLIQISEPERYAKEPTAYRLSKIFRIKSKESDS